MAHIALLSFIALITMVNPLAVIPSFVAMTDGLPQSLRARIAATAGIATTAALLIFFMAGNYLFRFFGITVPAFQIMGGIIFFINALRTLMQDETRIRKPLKDCDEGEQGETIHADASHATSIAVVPLAIPMLSGPGAITSVMVLVNLYAGIGERIAVAAAILGVGLASWLSLLAAVPLSRFIGPRGRLVFSKIMALLLGAIGVQFVLNALKPLMIEIVKAG